MKNKKRKRQELASSLLPEVDPWKAVQDKPLSYKEKQELADIVSHRQQLARLKRRLRSNQVENRTSAILRATPVDAPSWLRPPVKKWDNSPPKEADTNSL